MNNSKIFKIYITLLLGVILSYAVTATVNYDDSWTYSHSSSSDGTAWGGYTLNMFASGFSGYADCLCLDWCDDGSPDNTVAIWDTCTCVNWVEELSCKSYSTIVTNVCNQGGCSEDPYLNADHPINTGNSGDRWTCAIDIKEYRDCDNSNGQQATVDHNMKNYYIIYPIKSLCNGQDIDTLGNFGSSWYTFDYARSCSSAYTRCDTNAGHTHHDNQEITTATGTIPDPCSTKDGSTSNYACSANGDCYSGSCSGAKNTYLGYCDYDGSNGFEVDRKVYAKTCGGTGYYSYTDIGWTDTTCSSAMGSSNYICDYDLADNGGEYSSYSASNYCKKKEYASCSANSECWNYYNGGGYYCMGSAGNAICTTGDNGKNCYNNDDSQCDSARCDTTCQARLSIGNTCNENSDCTSSICCSGTCSATCSPNIDVNPSSLTFNIGQ